MEHIKKALLDANQVLNHFLTQESQLIAIEKSIQEFSKTLSQGGRILTCGNGGSMCDSMHFAEELTGRFRKDRPALAAHSMGDAGHLTCVANDFGYDHVFSRNVEAWGREGDTLLAISTSGNSSNIIKAVEYAHQKKIKTVGLLGKDGGKLKNLVSIPIVVPSNITDRIQEIHIKIIHIFIEGIERSLFPNLY
jgi:D-sedoheptulose 7-phosphate isomerase